MQKEIGKFRQLRSEENRSLFLNRLKVLLRRKRTVTIKIMPYDHQQGLADVDGVLHTDIKEFKKDFTAFLAIYKNDLNMFEKKFSKLIYRKYKYILKIKKNNFYFIEDGENESVA
jgi:hypothetical protein